VQLKKPKEIKMLENKLTQETKFWRGGGLWNEEDKNENLKKKKPYQETLAVFRFLSHFLCLF